MFRRILPFVLASTIPVFGQQTPAADPDASAPAASPAQNRVLKPFPPAGIAIPDADRAELTAGVEALGKEIAALKLAKLPPTSQALLPDVEIFHKAVDWALRYNEFFNVKEVGAARELLKEGHARAAALRDGKAPWTTATGPVVRGYRSRIDGSVQPYGVIVPATWTGTADKKARPLWIWNHGRGDTLTELSFITQRMKSAGEFSPADTFVLHPYGRFCNATKFAGETDVFEGLAATKAAYPVDSQRLVNAGFSMGGASAWHLGAHFPGLWAASHAGAGFAETAEYAGVFSAGKTPPPWWEVILYRWYDATVAAANFSNHPMFAYHGSEDKQGQSTAIMKRFAEKEGVTIQEFIGPGVAHKYEPATKKAVQAKIEEAVNSVPVGRIRHQNVHLTTYSLIYPACDWLRIDALERSWERADVRAELTAGGLKLTTQNIHALVLDAAFGVETIALPTTPLNVTIDGQALALSARAIGRSGRLEKNSGKWALVTAPPKQVALSKTPNVCGPIDHAFMDAFVFVKPTGAPLTPALGEWTQRELSHATKQWRAIFRGDAPAVDDSQLTPAQIASSHLVLWGDPSSNAVLKKIAAQLPVKWTAEGVEFGGVKYPATHAPILIFPNPLNPAKYVVLNSGFTFSRPIGSGTNSQQTPKLPDWAIVDTTVPPDERFPGKIVEAGFFDEQWRFTTVRPK